MITISPTNLKTFLQCPRKFQAQYITKELPWVQSPAAARGDQLHKLLETACEKGWGAIEWPKKEALIKSTANKFVDTVWALRNAGWDVQVERQIAIDGLGGVEDWWSKTAWARSKLDICATHPEKDFAIIIDWKTGKPWDDELQLHLNAMCLNAVTRIHNYHIMFAYLDLDSIKPYTVTVDLDAPALFDRQKHMHSPLLQTLLDIDKLKEAYAVDKWFETKNKFCGWCGLTSCRNSKK